MTGSNWVRRTRKRQGLKGFELAELMSVSAARVSVIEKDEMRGALTLKMMDKVAKAMGCRFEYQIVPDNRKDELQQNAVNAKINEAINENTLEEKKFNKSVLKVSDKPRYRVVDSSK